jgi:predicted choloylglycine hydrolase
MEVLTANGTPYEIGVQRGDASAELIHRSREMLCPFDADDEPTASLIDGICNALADRLPGALDEARGVADASGLSMRQAVALSVCADVTGRLPAYCSLLGVQGANGLLVGKNLDTEQSMAPLQVVERLAPEGGHGYVHVTTAGAMWTDGGVNERGLALVNASLASTRTDAEGLPDGMVVREVLARCATVEEAVDMLADERFLTFGENVLLADAGGDMVVVEKLPGGQRVRRGDGVALACNHVLSAELAGEVPQHDPIAANSRARMDALAEIGSGPSEWTTESVGAALDRLRQAGADGLWTVATYVVSPEARSLRVLDDAAEIAVPRTKGEADVSAER